MTGVLKVRTTKAFGESTVSKILELMENSSSHKSRSESFISRFAKVYTPAVCYSALALAILPPLALTVSGADADWGTWVYRALTFLVISCPCALVISIPLSFFAGLGGAGKEGVLIKGSNYLEALSQTKTVVFDKTGTLTQGVFEVSAVHHSPMAQEKLLEYAALAECASSHPISKSLQKAAGGALDRSRVTDIQEHSGRGVTAVVDGVPVYSEEVVWYPKTNSDPAYHYEGILSAFKSAASKMPRVDAIGVSSAGIYVDNRAMVASLFLQVPRDEFDKQVKDIYIRAAKELGDVPLEVANDGDVTALAGAMSLEENRILGIAMGTSEAAGYVDGAAGF